MRKSMMDIAPFQLERYFARYEFNARYLLSSSDCEALTMAELLSLADGETKSLWNSLKLGYTESLGHPLLRAEIAALYREITNEDVLAAVPEEGIFLLMHALLSAGDHVVCTFPGYQSLYEVARSVGCAVSLWEPVEDNGWKFDVEDLMRLVQPNTRLIVVNFPHNPTGALPAQAEFSAILEIARERGIYVLSDEMYRFLELEAGTTLPAACDLYERAVSLGGLSKTFGLPGLRTGWLATRDREILQKASTLKDYTTICGSAPGEVLAIVALRAKETIIPKQVERTRKNQEILEAFFARYADLFQSNPARGGSICFPRMLKVESTYDFCEELVLEAGIMLLPSRVFQFGDQHMRFGFGRANLAEVLERFGDYLDEYFPI
jgi:aspartate/methionine/tyrosine aminotransferase